MTVYIFLSANVVRGYAYTETNHQMMRTKGKCQCTYLRCISKAESRC